MDDFLPLNSQNCPVTRAVRIMGRRWKPLVLYYLRDRSLRFNELRRCIPEATQKMLTQTLRELERDGILRRKVYSQVPPKVVYSITRYGHTLDPILVALCDWGQKSMRLRPGRDQGDPVVSNGPTRRTKLPVLPNSI